MSHQRTLIVLPRVTGLTDDTTLAPMQVRLLHPLIFASIVILGSAVTAWAGQGPVGDQQTLEQDQEPGRVIFAISPAPEADPLALAFAGRPMTEVTISGNEITKEHVIRRELELRVGEPFHVETMEADIVRLENLEIFSAVQIDLKESDDGGVAVNVIVGEMPWIIPYVAVRVSDQDNIQLGPAASSLNLFGQGISLSGRTLFGGASTYQLQLEWPWIAFNHLSLSFFGGHIRRDDDLRDFGEISDEFTPWVGTFIGRNWRARGGVSYLRMNADRDGVTLSPSNRDTLVRVGAGLGLDTRDSWRNPHRGWENDLQVLRTGGPMGGEGDFWTTDLDIRRYQPVGRHTLVLSGLGSFQTGELGVDIPSYMDYRLGGANSVRGYSPTTLGRELHGKNQLLTTVEYQHLLWDIREITVYGFNLTMGLELAAFVDTGTAWNEPNEFGASRTRTGFGVGVRPLVPAVGEVRLDVGFSTEGDVVFHLGVNPKMVAQRLRIR